MSARGSYRTKSKAGDIVAVEKHKYAVIKNEGYKHTLSPVENAVAYVMPIKSDNNMTMTEDGVMMNGHHATDSDLRESFDKEKITSIRWSILHILYNIVLQYILAQGDSQMSNKINIFIRHIFDYMSYPSGNKKIESDLIMNISELQSIVGFIKSKAYPLISFMEYDEDKGTVSLSAPYIFKVIGQMKESSNTMLKNQTEKALLQKVQNMHTYVMKPSILKIKNPRAVELVRAIVIAVENTGIGDPSLTLQKIYDECPILRLSDAADNRRLYDDFSRAWGIIEKKIYLSEKYEKLQLPDLEKNRPYYSNRNKKYEFRLDA